MQCIHCHGQVQSLVGELRSYKASNSVTMEKKKKKETKQLKGALQVEETEKALTEYSNWCCPHHRPWPCTLSSQETGCTPKPGKTASNSRETSWGNSPHDNLWKPLSDLKFFFQKTTKCEQEDSDPTSGHTCLQTKDQETFLLRKNLICDHYSLADTWTTHPNLSEVPSPKR